MSCPDFLYKYIPSTHYKIFPYNGNTKLPVLRFSPINTLNDIYEISPSVDLQRKAQDIKELAKENGLKLLNPKKAKHLARKINADASADARNAFQLLHANNDLGVLSLTENPHSPVMWNFYAENHTGLVFKYNIKHEFFQAHSNCIGPIQVQYSANRPVAKGLSEGPKAVKEWLFTKSSEWQFEREWRMVHKWISNLRALPNAIGTKLLPPDAISAVYLGLHTNKCLSKLAKMFCDAHGIFIGRMEFIQLNTG